MIVPDIVKDKWKSQPTTVEILEANLQAEKVKTYQLQKRLELLEMSQAALINRIENL
jgi:hypothetical protein